MKYLLFDQNAISTYVSVSRLQSTEYAEGQRFVQHICGELSSEIFENTAIEYTKDGILFVGQRNTEEGHPTGKGRRIFCIDLVACNILVESSNRTDLLTLVQKALRLTLKIWNRQPFSSSERYHGSKSILFPFAKPDHRRIVIERSNNVLRLENRGIDYPLLAYKYNAEDPSQAEDIVDTHVLRQAGEMYISQYTALQNKLATNVEDTNTSSETSFPLEYVRADEFVKRDDFAYWDYKRQYAALTDSQKFVVDFEPVVTPLRIDGAAGTGKTISIIMRAYHLLKLYQEKRQSFNIIFFAHSESTCKRNEEMFCYYPDGRKFLSPDSMQRIRFVTLLSFCKEFAKIPENTLLEHDAADAKSYQLMLIEDVVEKARSEHRVKTFSPLLNERLRDLFDCSKTDPNVLFYMLQHEFSIQIKGRTNCTIDKYYEIESIANGIPCASKRDKEFIFSLFSDYQEELRGLGSFDVDDVTMEALSHLNAPIWRRARMEQGYDYIIVDEMHLFNINEQSVFHFLTKSLTQKDVPICFALDYNQAIGDRGNTKLDYIENAFGQTTEQRLHTVFRNSPQIAEFCAAISASGTLMFGEHYSNPYRDSQNGFTNVEESKSSVPELHLYANDDEMVASIGTHIKSIIKDLQCKPVEIAVISFENSLLTEDGKKKLEEVTGRQFNLIGSDSDILKDSFFLASPDDINGLEFQAVILVGVDEGRVPQNAGVNDISQHFIKYSAYNLLYLTSSRAKYCLRLLGSKVQRISSCLEHSIATQCLHVINHTQ